MDARLSGVRHGASPIADEDELLLAAVLSGTSVLRQRTHEIELSNGEAVLLRRSNGPFTIAHPDAVHFLGLRIPDVALRPLVGGLDDVAARLIPSRSGVLGLLTGYVRTAMDHGLLTSSPAQATVVSHVHDLVALILGTSGDAARMAKGRGLKAARLRAIMVDAAARIESPGLSAASMA